MTNFICNTKYVCNLVLEKIISYLSEKDKINIKFTCKYMKNKIKIYKLRRANHLTGLIYPELTFLNLKEPKPKKVNMPESKAIYVKYSETLRHYDYDFENVQKLYIKYYYKDYAINKFFNLKELYIHNFINNKHDTKFFNKKFALSFKHLEILSIPKLNYNFFIFLKILRCNEFNFIRDEHTKIETFIISSFVNISNCYIENLCINKNFYYNNISLLISKTQILNLIFVNITSEIAININYSDSIIENIFIVNCSEKFINYIETFFNKKCIISGENILPKKNIFDIDLFK